MSSGSSDRGLYVVWLRVNHPLTVQIGALGRFSLNAGVYAYVGSAQRHRQARVNRHLRVEGKRLRWHIDYLRTHSEVLGVQLLEGEREDECRLAARLAALAGAFRAIAGFGASDCGCPGHLIGFSRMNQVAGGRTTMLEKLTGTDRRSIGRADQVAEEIAGNQALFDEVFNAMFFDDPVIRMRASDAVEKASRRQPERLYPHKHALLYELPKVQQKEVRWHLVQMLPRLPLEEKERRQAAAIAEGFLSDKSTIVRVNALQALADLAQGDPELEGKVQRRLAEVLESGAPAEKARARKLLSEGY